MALGNFGLIISYLVRFLELSKEQENIILTNRAKFTKALSPIYQKLYFDDSLCDKCIKMLDENIAYELKIDDRIFKKAIKLAIIMFFDKNCIN